MGDEQDKTEFDAACARFQNLRGDFKSLYRMKYDLYIEGIESDTESNPLSYFKIENMKPNSSGYLSSMFFESHSRGGCELVCGVPSECLRELG
jgi:hypothetical protein